MTLWLSSRRRPGPKFAAPSPSPLDPGPRAARSPGMTLWLSSRRRPGPKFASPSPSPLHPGPRAARSPGMTRLFPIAVRPAADRSWTSASLVEWTIAILQRPESLIGWNRRADLVQVPLALRFRRLLGLDQVRRMDLASIRPDHSLAEERIVGRRLLHLGDDLGAIVALERFDRLQV